ncbi:alcohol oxidase [Mycena latifolia]|nr:alcohol oxidase [Mycena latifolia]
MWPFDKYPALGAADVGGLTDLTFDFIIVGGGTAGCCLASRLSEDPNISVLLLERGPVSDDWQAHVPLLSANQYRSGAPAANIPLSPSVQGDERVIHAVVGEGLGGGSLINGQLYSRGIADSNKWKNMGRTSWGYDELEPYFVKSESSLSQPPSTFRGKDGVVMNAATSLGIPHSPDLNSPDAPVVCYAAVDITMDRNMHRNSTFRAFLPHKVAQARKKNLKICTNTIVTGIKFAPDVFKSKTRNPKAVGVYFEDTHLKRSPRNFCALASREVILCAGAIGSPQILMLSGIGPRQHLFNHSLVVVKDLPGVGSYLRDHLAISMSYQVPMQESLHALKNSVFRALVEVAKYLFYGGGLLGIPFVQSTIFDLDARNPDNIPDIEVMSFAHRACEGEHHMLDRLGVFSFFPALTKPKSSGTVRLVSTDPHARAQIHPKYLSDPADYTLARKAVRLVLRLGQQVRAQGYPLKDLVVPESEDDDSLDQFIRENHRTTFHYTSTCRMAPEDDDQPGVVDDELKVHGIDGLRVCDCSIFPDILSVHPMAGAVVVAEKCADLIKKVPPSPRHDLVYGNAGYRGERL